MPDSKPLAVLQFGKTGQVARELLRLAPAGNYHVRALGRADADFANPQRIADIVHEAPACDAVVNVAAYTAVDGAESDEAGAMTVNAEAPGALARACADRGVPLIHLSTDYVFDGRSPLPLRESDPTGPINAYGRSKLAGENLIREALPQHVILRTAWVYSPYGANFLKTMLRLGMEREILRVVNDQFGAPTSAADIAETVHVVLARLACAPSDGAFGTFHYAGQGRASWHDFAAAILAYGKDFYPLKAKLQTIATSEYPTLAPRPRNSLLDCGKIEVVYGVRPKPWESAMREVVSRLAHEGGMP